MKQSPLSLCPPRSHPQKQGMYRMTSGRRAANSYVARMISGERTAHMIPGGSGGRSGPRLVSAACGALDADGPLDAGAPFDTGGACVSADGGGSLPFEQPAIVSVSATPSAETIARSVNIPRSYHLAVHSKSRMARLPRIADLDAASSGTGYFLCARKEKRTGRGGPFLTVLLQDVSGEIGGKVFQDVEAAEVEFEAGEFVAVQGKGNSYHQRLELVIDKIRRVIPSDAQHGFREEDCIRAAPRPVDEMWQELAGRIENIEDPHVKTLAARLVERYGDRLRIWPAARTVHHAYRSGLLEHVLKIMEVSVLLAERYDARRDLVIAGALLHDLGKLDELNYDVAIEYSVEGNLVGHIAIGVGMLRDAVREMPGFPHDLQIQLEHLILSHHGAKDRGSPVEPMTVEAFILAAVDELDATLHQVRHHIADDDSTGPFTVYHRRLDRVLFKPPES